MLLLALKSIQLLESTKYLIINANNVIIIHIQVLTFKGTFLEIIFKEKTKSVNSVIVYSKKNMMLKDMRKMFITNSGLRNKYSWK